MEWHMRKGKLASMPLVTGVAFLLITLGVGLFLSNAVRTMARGQTSSGGHETAPSGIQTKRALLVGIDHYKYPDRVPPLAGSLNDVDDIRQILVGKFEFAPGNILVLRDSQATHVEIMTAIRRLVDMTQPGDIVVFHYSGHGSQARDTTGKMISGLDGTIVPYDSRDPEGKVFDISGAELHAALVALSARTKNLTFILDSCHSGTLVRGARVRSIPADTRDVPVSNAPALRGVKPAGDESSPKFTFISAATSRESAFEHFAEGKAHGALTYFLARQLRSASAGATYRDVMDGVFGDVTANYPTQHPSLEGAAADQYVFGDATSLVGAYVTALPSPHDARTATLAIGQVQGATPGSIYDVYAPGSKRFAPPEQPTAKVQLTTVEALHSEAIVLSGGDIAPASRAIEREHRYGSSRARIYIDAAEGKQTLESIRDALQSAKYIDIVDRPTQCNLQIRRIGQNIQILAADSSILSPSVLVSDSSAVERVVEQVKEWAKWFNVLSIRNAQPGVEVKFSIQRRQTRDAIAPISGPDVAVSEGETVDAVLENESDRDLYIAILDLSSDGSIGVVYPVQQGAEEVLKPHLTLSRSLRTFIPKGRSNVTDVLKVFASYTPIDLTPLTQGTIRSEDDGTGGFDPVQELLMDSAGASRGVAPLLINPVKLGTWTTAQRVLFVKRKN
jgi:hypothetical protein